MMIAQTILAQSEPASPGPWRAGGRAMLGQSLGRLPPAALLMLAIVSIQLASALATVLFASLGPAGTAFWSTAFSALAMTALWPPKIDRRIRDHATLILAFGLADAIMALPFLLALQYIPLGIASTIGFLGPLGLALAGSRRPIHFLWIGLAAIGVVLLMPATTQDLSLLGLGLAGLSALGWAGFVLLSKRAGRIFENNDGLTFGLWTSSLMLLPFALQEGGLLRGGALALAGALGVSLLGAVLPMTLEYRALQRMSARAYGILVTLEPAVGMLIGALCLAQPIGPRAATAVACVTAAALGVTLLERSGER